MDKPEIMLKKLRRLESNMKCPNCGTPAQPGIGFGNICIKYKTFVCDLCKTSHQAISHRVKSVSMSTWTAFDVNELSVEQNGGNAVAVHVWLANAPPPGGRYFGGFRPKEGDKVEVFKQFVTDCYEHGKFKATTPFDKSTVTDVAPVASQKAKPVVQQTSSAQRVQQLPIAVAIVKVAKEMDLLAFDSPRGNNDSFGDFSEHAAKDSFATFQSAAPADSRGNSDFLCDFGNFPATAPTFAPPPHAVPPPAHFDPFNSNSNANAPFMQPFQSAPAVPFDNYAHSVHNSASMPSFPTVPAVPVLYHGVPEAQGQQHRPKSTLDLSSLYDQKLPQSTSTSGMGGMGGGTGGMGSGMAGMMLNSSDVISSLGGNNMMYQNNSSSSSYPQQMNGNNGSGGMMGNGYGMNNNNGSNNGNMGAGGGGWNNGPAAYGNGNGYNSQQQQQQYQPQNQQQQYQPQQQQQQHTQQYQPQQQQYQQPQVFRGVVSAQQNVPKGPVDAFDFSGSSFMANMNTKH